jgi:hypothetical protein
LTVRGALPRGYSYVQPLSTLSIVPNDTDADDELRENSQRTTSNGHALVAYGIASMVVGGAML